MRVKTVVFAAVILSGCSMGYWPAVDGPTDSRYQATVRECQTASHEFGAGDLVAGGMLGAVLAGNQSQSTTERAAIDACMTKYGYKVKTSG